MIVTLYTTAGCHLCEQAEAILLGLHSDGLIQSIRPVDIANDPGLMERYGVRIPVIVTEDPASAVDLGWPFARADVIRFLENHGND